MSYRQPDLLSEVRACRDLADALEYQIFLARITYVPWWARVGSAIGAMLGVGS